jgi:hypothetical protein
VQAKSPSMLLAVLVTSAIALLDAWTGDRASLLGLLIAGPLLAAASLNAQRTAIIGLYALGLAVLLGIPDGIFGTTEHLLGCLVVATGAAFTLLSRSATAKARSASARSVRKRLGCQPGGPPHFLEGGRPLDVTVLLPWALFIGYGCTACRRANVWVLSSVSRRANAREEVNGSWGRPALRW